MCSLWQTNPESLFPNTDQSSNADTGPQNTDAMTEPHSISQVAEVEQMMLSSGSQVQMQTATSVVTNSSGSPLLSVRIMLGSGSQRKLLCNRKPSQVLEPTTEGT